MRALALLSLLLVCLLAACGGRARSDDVDDFGADDVFDVVNGSDTGPRLEQIALTTEIDTITFTPTGPTASTFPATTSRLYLCFRVRGAPERATLDVTWYREGDLEPLSATHDALAGDGRFAAEHAPTRPFRPGAHSVLVEIDGDEVARVPFTIEGAAGDASTATATAVVEELAVYRSLDRRGRPQGQPVDRLDAGPRSLHGVFRIRGAGPGTAVRVVWTCDGARAAVTELGEVEGDRSLSASIGGSSSPLPNGEYRVEVHVNGARSATSRFSIGVSGGPQRLSDLALTTAVDPRTQRPSTSPQTTFTGAEPTLYLCIRYEGLPAGASLEVRWFQDSFPDEPMSVSTVRAQRSGSMSASFSPDAPLPAGAYHADVVLAGEVLGTAAFTVAAR